MACPRSAVAVLLVVLLVCRYCSAQGCNPSPPSNFSVPPVHSNIDFFWHPSNFLRAQLGIGGVHGWSVFTASQVQTYGLWCQVREQHNAGMGSNIGDWYYPTAGSTPDGFTLLPNTTDDGAPYQSLKCTNQIGLVVDGDVTNNQGIVRCSTTVPSLYYKARFFGVYLNFTGYTGPVVDTVMTVSLLSARDDPNIDFTLSFNVSNGPPSYISCTNGNNVWDIACRNSGPHCVREVIRSHYVSSSLPDITRVVIKQVDVPREARTYNCTVTVEGRMPNMYGYFNRVTLGTPRSSTVSITVAGTPTAVSTNRNGLTSVLVSWIPPSPTPAGYEVFFNITGGSRLSGGNTSSTQLTLNGLTLGKTYSIFVVAFGAEGDPVFPSAPSTLAVVLLDIPQLLPADPMLSPRTTGPSIMVSWTPPQILLVQFIPDSYTVTYSCQLLCGSAPTTGSVTVSDGGATTHTLSSLIRGSRCDVSVTAVFGSITSNTVTSSTNTTSAAPTGAPGGLTSTSVESRSLIAVWGTVPCPQQRGPITGYRLRYSSSSGTFIVNIPGENNRQHVLTGLTPFTRYSVQVAAVNDRGIGPFSEPALTVETLQEAPGPVSGLSASPEVVQLTILWMPPSEPNGVITDYEVGFNYSGWFTYTNTSLTQLTLRNLLPNTIVAFSVRAYTIIGPGDNVSDHASTGGVPIIRIAAVFMLDSTTVNVSWTPVNLPVSVVDHYTVYYMSANEGRRQCIAQMSTFPATSLSGVVQGLVAGQQYQFGVSVTLVAANGQMHTGPVSNFPQLVTIGAVNSSSVSGLLAGLVVGWLLFAISLGGNVIMTVFLVRRTGQTHSPKKSPPAATNDPVYEEPEAPTKSKMMSECIAYDTHQQQSRGDPQYESTEFL